MKAQMYTVPHNDEGSREEARPGQFVFNSNESTTVSGFVFAVNDDRMCFCMFEPTEMPEHGISLASKLSHEVVYKYLEKSLADNPEMRPHWIEALSNSK